mmetsp:Transcript_12686/g.27552  ORF Transcript_12686/g.27552 Transcript_12686/m.27552 type:complete len:694 (-) Transcript_12686:268-2349(-)
MQSTKEINGQGSDDDEDTVALMQSILSNKPLACDDINTIEDSRKELKRIRNLMHDYKQAQTKKNAEQLTNKVKKGARNAIHDGEHINDYVKKDIPKGENIRELIYDAIKKNVLFESNTEDELMEIIDVFEPCNFKAMDVVIQQGERGTEFYIVESGELSITVRMTQDEDDANLMDKTINDVKVGSYGNGCSFGELALIYGSPRAATIIATDDCKLWRVKRGWYRGVVGQHRKRLHMEKVKFLPKVNVGKKRFGDVLKKDQLDAMAQLLKQEYFKQGDTILREGESGNTFYIIQSGEVSIFRRDLGDKPIATLGKEKFFGEKALLEDDVRQATVVAASSTVVCYVMTRGDFTRVLGNLKDILDGKIPSKKGGRKSALLPKKKFNYKLEDLQTLNILGQGAFGKVKLAKAKDTGECYALKAQGKRFIVENGQNNYVLNELKLMNQLVHPNILVMHCAMQDSAYIYFLLELLPGGELMNILEDNHRFPEEWVRFYSASVVLAYTEFHRHRIAYRDLKPENLVLDAKGYCVVVDLGLAKQLDDGPTYTFCGTPDYIAPEIILGTGYNWAVDYWALGILLYELHSGSAPFQSYGPTGTAKKILKGQINFPTNFSKQMSRVIKELLTKDPTRRLGCMSDRTEGVMQHRFYHGFDWQGLLDKEIDVPFKPKIPKNIETIGWKDYEKDVAKSSKWNPNLDI